MMMELKPYDSRKSFYGKARVEHDGDICVCYSYHTPVAAFTHGMMFRLWGGYSATTQRHLNAFAVYCGMRGVQGKAAWDNMAVVPMEMVRLYARHKAA